MAEKIKLGIIGMSEGNGHPYSWSAIFNGYDQEKMKDCPFPAIPGYLNEHNFPEDGLYNLGEVTHIWTQNRNISEHIASASKIENVVDEMENLIGEVDAILLARDDAENHYEMSMPFLKAGLPVFIDKPLALSQNEANKILEGQQYEDQVFTCSSLRYAKELKLTDKELDEIGTIRYVEASVPKNWDTYAVHLIEPIIAQLTGRGRLKEVISRKKNEINLCIVEWEKVSAFLKVTGTVPSLLKISYFGEKGSIEKQFTDPFNCFKRSLEKFVHIIKKEDINITRSETLEIIHIIEEGRK